jgi:DNA adenine methylase
MQRTVPNSTPFQNYFGGKSGAGVYQSIINHIPPHRVFMTLFAGNCGVFKYMRRAEWSIINDLDYQVFEKWHATGLWVNGDVRILNKDALTFLTGDLKDAEYQRQWKHTFIYLDPPYLKSSRRGQLDVYDKQLSELQHIELLDIVLALPKEIKVMISHYPCPLYDEKLKGWQIFDFEAKTRQGMATERIYMNYQLDGHLHDYSYIGSNFRVREKYKRIITNFFLKLDRMEPLLRNAMLQEYELQHRNKVRVEIQPKTDNLEVNGWVKDEDGQWINDLSCDSWYEDEDGQMIYEI